MSSRLRRLEETRRRLRDGAAAAVVAAEARVAALAARRAEAAAVLEESFASAPARLGGVVRAVDLLVLDEERQALVLQLARAGEERAAAEKIRGDRSVTLRARERDLRTCERLRARQEAERALADRRREQRESDDRPVVREDSE